MTRTRLLRSVEPLHLDAGHRAARRPVPPLRLDLTAWTPIFQRASAGRTAEVLSVLDEAAGWLHARGTRQWPPNFEPSWVEEAIARGETWLVRVGGPPGQRLDEPRSSW